MLYGRHNRAMNTDVRHRAAKRATARALVAFVVTSTILMLGSTASATPLLTLRFDSTTVVADGINATPVVLMFQVINTGSALDVNSFAAQYSVTTSPGTVSPTGLTAISASIPNPGVFDAGAPQNAEPDTFTSGSIPSVGIYTDGVTSTLASGTSNVIAVAFTIPAGVPRGTQYIVDFLTGTEDGFRSFSNELETYDYANGNNGSTFGVITVVPEPSTGTAIGAATVLMSGVAIAQRRMRRRNSTVELVG